MWIFHLWVWFFMPNESLESIFSYGTGFIWIRPLAPELQPLEVSVRFSKNVDFSKKLYIKNWNFRLWNSKIEIAIAPSKMSFITSSKKVFCVESESRFEKNIIFYEKIIFANFIIDFASKFAILGLESTKKSKIWDKNRKNDFFIVVYFFKNRESESEQKSFLLLATKLISLRNI